MEITITHGDAMRIAIKGRLDTVTSPELTEAYKKETVVEPLVSIDMKDVEYISSAGLTAILAMKKELVKKGKQLEVCNLNSICLEVFKVTGFINILTIK